MPTFSLTFDFLSDRHIELAALQPPLSRDLQSKSPPIEDLSAADWSPPAEPTHHHVLPALQHQQAVAVVVWAVLRPVDLSETLIFPKV